MTDIVFKELNPLDFDVVESWIELEEAVWADTYPGHSPAAPPRLRLGLVTPNKLFSWDRTVALLDDKVVGFMELGRDLFNNTHVGEVEIKVHPDYRRRGIGSQLVELAERKAREAEGIRTLLSVTDHSFAEAPDRITPGLPFARKHGFAEALTEVHRINDMQKHSDDSLSDLYLKAFDASRDYDVILFDREVPAELIKGVGDVKGRMVADAPMGALDLEEEVFSAEWFTMRTERCRQMGTLWLGAVARHRETGEVAAFTEVSVLLGDEDRCYQGDTIVAPDHRGRRLGARIKIENQRLLRKWRPSMRYIHTWNAEENSFMIKVNEQIGYRVYCKEAGLQKKLEN